MLEINFTLVIFAFSFLVFIYLLNLTLYKPVGKLIEARKELIERDYDRAKNLSEEAKGTLENYTKKIKEAKHSSQVLIQEAINETNKKKEEKLLSFINVLTKEKEAALKKIGEEKEKSMKELQKELVHLTEFITNKVLGMEKDLVRTH